jgi:hypothetical protein
MISPECPTYVYILVELLYESVAPFPSREVKVEPLTENFSLLLPTVTVAKLPTMEIPP